MNLTIPKYLLVISLSFLAPALAAQERLTSIQSNPRLFNNEYQIQGLKTVADTLSLPFLDDFSASVQVPDPFRWTGSSCFINNQFAVNPPTYQVATFDMMDSAGRIYSLATVNPFLADELSSRPVDLFFPQDTTIYLSFFYQSGGYGDTTELTDSLVVDFYAPASQEWYRVWSTPGGPSREFRIAMINITDSRFLQTGFRFRFRNYASLANAYEPSLKVNADHWNLDYVYLDRNRHYQDTMMADAALTQPVGSLLVDYTAMPWEHFAAVGLSAVKTYFQININNLSIDDRNYSPVFTITPLEEGGTPFQKNLTDDRIDAFERISYDEIFNYGFQSSVRDSARFQINLNLNQEMSDWIPSNDQVTNVQTFTNYYAYDDGTAEAGYGLVGEGTGRAKLAYRFNTSYTVDSLVAVSYCFNHSFESAGSHYFHLAIWADEDNLPGTLLYTQEGSIPKYDSLNSFQTFALDSALIVPSTYYVGWIQTSSDFLNLGFDRQNNHQEDILYNINGSWQASGFKGSLMIRPVFANKSRKAGTGDIRPWPGAVQTPRFYPNPADESFTLILQEGAMTSRIRLINLQGKVVLDVYRDSLNGQIAVGNLPDGYYLLEVRPGSGVASRQKILILHE